MSADLGIFEVLGLHNIGLARDQYWNSAEKLGTVVSGSLARLAQLFGILRVATLKFKPSGGRIYAQSEQYFLY